MWPGLVAAGGDPTELQFEIAPIAPHAVVALAVCFWELADRRLMTDTAQLGHSSAELVSLVLIQSRPPEGPKPTNWVGCRVSHNPS